MLNRLVQCSEQNTVQYFKPKFLYRNYKFSTDILRHITAKIVREIIYNV